MRRTLRHVVLLVILPVMLSACSEIMPGLNVHLGRPSQHQYTVVADDSKQGYSVAKADGLPSYEITPITPAVLKATASQPQLDFDYTLPAILPSDVPAEYRIGPGDVIYVTVWDHPELSTPTGPINDLASISNAAQGQQQFVQGRLVAADGTLFFPYVGIFKAQGLTVAEMRNLLASRLTSVIAHPQVDVRIIGFRSSRIEISGEVSKPGTVTLDDMPRGIMQVINQSGGLTTNASRRRAILVRGGKRYLIDLAGLLSGSRPVSNPLLMPGDTLHIPDRSADQVYVLGAVDRQQPVIMQQASLPLIEALTTAGGLDFTRGKQDGVIVFRMKKAGDQPKADVFTIDLSKPEGMLLASQFELQPRDVVYVQSTALAQYNSIVNQLLPTITTIFYLDQLTRSISNR